MREVSLSLERIGSIFSWLAIHAKDGKVSKLDLMIQYELSETKVEEIFNLVQDIGKGFVYGQSIYLPKRLAPVCAEIIRAYYKFGRPVAFRDVSHNWSRESRRTYALNDVKAAFNMLENFGIGRINYKNRFTLGEINAQES